MVKLLHLPERCSSFCYLRRNRMSQQDHPGNAKRFGATLRTWGGHEVRWWPVALALVVVLFPFDWLGEVWPFFGQALAVVFVTARDHAIGHATMFFLLGTLMLLALPRLGQRPFLYLGAILLVALGQETLQDLFKQQSPTLWDGRDMLFDLTGALVAFSAFWLWRVIRRKSNVIAR
jgi:hypothetical protein